MPLHALSNELITGILLHLDSHTTISKCSRQFHDIAEPILYSKIILNHPKSYTLFIRTLVAKPYLVKHVRHFQTSGHPYGWDFDLTFLSKGQRDWIRAQLPDAIHGKGTCNNWFKGMFFPAKVDWLDVPTFWDAITAFLLSIFSPTLQSIDMVSYGWMVTIYPYIDMVLESSNYGRRKSLAPVSP